MLKIAVVTRYFPSSGEPSQGRSLYETLRVIARRADVHVFYPNAEYPGFLRPASRIYGKLDLNFRPPDVNVTYINYPALPLVSRPLNGWMAKRAVLRQVRAFAPDVVFGCFLYPEGFAALEVAKALRVPVAVMSIGSDLNRIEDAISARHTRSVVHGVDCLVTVCDDLRKTAVAMGAKAGKARAVLNGCNRSVFFPRDRAEAKKKLGIAPESETVVCVGRMDLKKGLRELVEAMASLHAARPNLHCYMVGKGPDRPAIEEAVQAQGAGAYVHLIPGCAFDEVAVWMAAADAVTLPSYMEGCPNVILEALASGRPVVATNVGGIPELVNQQCGRLVPPRDPAALAKGLAEVLDRTWDAAAISSQNSRSWESVADELLDILESLKVTR